MAEAIRAVLGAEAGVVDEDLTIIAGTGNRRAKNGSNEEGGERGADFTYARVLRTGKPLIADEPATDPTYNPLPFGETCEMGEICCPDRPEG